MLATREDHWGHRLAVVLGAIALLAKEPQYGIRQVFTGIREGNAPSEHLCAKLGQKTEYLDIFAVEKVEWWVWYLCWDRPHCDLEKVDTFRNYPPITGSFYIFPEYDLLLVGFS